MNNDLRQALRDAMRIEYAWTDKWNDVDYQYAFSNKFSKNIDKICKKAEREYISVGRFRVTKATVAIAIIIMIMALTGCGFVVRQAIINWNETENMEQRAVDISFDIDDPDNILSDKGFVKPTVPENYEIINEEKFEDVYRVEYIKGDQFITYKQEAAIEDIALTIDTEDNEFNDIEICGYKGHCFSKYGIQVIIWSDGVYLYSISGNLEMAEIISIADNINR